MSQEFIARKGDATRLKPCKKCGRKFQQGEIVVSRHGRYKSKHYHQACWLSLFVEDSENDVLEEPKLA